MAPSQTCIIDWESTTTRPLWAAAHAPAFLQTSPFTSKLFRATMEKLASQRRTVMVDGHPRDFGAIVTEWLQHESAGTRLRMAHRCIEWDGWEEGLVESILGPEEQEGDWFRAWEDENTPPEGTDAAAAAAEDDDDASPDPSPQSPFTSTSPTLTEQASDGEDGSGKRRRGSTDSQAAGTKKSPRAGPAAAATTTATAAVAVVMVAAAQPVKVVAVEKEKERILDQRGDFCGGRGGELGRRLEAWLVVNGDAEGRVELARRWEGDDAIGGGDESPT